PAGAGAYGLAAGSDGNLWFNESTPGNVGRITTAGVVKEFPLPTKTRNFDITAGPDGNLWVTEFDASFITRVTTSGVATQYLLPSIGRQPYGIVTGPDHALWFTEFSKGKIGQFLIGSGTPPPQVDAEYPIPPPTLPYEITPGSDGALWFADFIGSIGRVTTSGTVTKHAVGQVSQSQSIVAGPDGALWFTETSSIGRLTTADALTPFPVPSNPPGLAAGPDEALGFTEQNVDKIGRMTTAGVVKEYPTLTKGGFPNGIVTGPDGALWFTEISGNIGRITTSGSVKEYPVP